MKLLVHDGSSAAAFVFRIVLLFWGFGFLGARAQTSDVFFVEPFANASEVTSLWTGGVPNIASDSTTPNGTGSCLQLSNSGNGTQYLSAPVTSSAMPVSALLGRRVVIKAQIKGANLSAKVNGTDGIDFALVYHLANGTTVLSNSSNAPVGTFGWQGYGMSIVVPTTINSSAISSITIQVGLQVVSGTAWVSELHVEADPGVVAETFDDGVAGIASRWTLGTASLATSAGYGGSGLALTLANPNPTTSIYRGIPIPAAALNAHRMVLSGMISGSNISTPPHSWNGIKLAVVTTNADGTTTVSQAPVPAGTFGWTNVYDVINLPQNVVSGYVEVGLELVSGAANFDNIHLDADPVLWSENFDGANVSKNWTGGAYTLVPNGTLSAMQITNSNAGGSVKVSQKLNFSALRGYHLLLQGSATGSNISTPPNSWNGVKVMLSWTNADGSTADSQLRFNSVMPPAGSGTFGWTSEFAIVDVPPNVTAATMTIGLELVSGTVTFDNLSVSLLDNSSPYWANPTGIMHLTQS